MAKKRSPSIFALLLTRPVRLRVRTPPFHGGDTSSNLVRATKALIFSKPFLIMISVYVLESLRDEVWYTGIAKDAENRLHEHNTGKNRFKKDINPGK